MREIGGYQVEKVLGKGGMGAVYLARDPGLNRLAAIKVMMTDSGDQADAIARFQREARATASIKHPNVALIYQVGSTPKGAPFIAMEHIGGGSLEDLIRSRTRLAISEVAGLMMQTCEALFAARKTGIIHRDIKPGNIMLTDNREVKLVDFGLAKFYREDSYRTVAGTILGTPRYMSPEQAQGREVDFRSDIYSVGATFYHLLAGRAPFDGDSPSQVMMKHVTSPLPPMRSINPEVPMEFDDIVRRCMAKDPNDRYQDYPDLIGELSRLKLQWHSRERGSLVANVHDMPTMKIDPSDDFRGAESSMRASATAVGTLTINDGEPEDKQPVWRFVIIGAAALGLVILIAAIMFMPGREQPDRDPTQRSGLAVLIERLVDQQQGMQASGAAVSQPNPDYIRYLATVEILRNLNDALFTYEFERREAPPDLATLVASGSTVVNFDTNDDGEPLDGWQRRLGYSPTSRSITSPGLDHRLNTEDDIEITRQGDIVIQDRTRYDRLEAEEEARLAD